MVDIVSSELNKAPESLPKGKFKVLFIEDNRFSKDRIKKIFEEKNIIEMTFFDKGEKALEALREAKKTGKPYELVVADWRMDDKLSGLGMAKRIQEEKLAEQTLMLTIFTKEELNTIFPEDKLKENGVREVIYSNRIENLHDLVYKELLRQRDLQIPQK